MKKDSKEQTKDYIAGIIRTGILRGEINTSSAITQEQLSTTLNVSKATVKEALEILVQEGFLERLANRHLRIIQLDFIQIKEVFSFLSSMEKQIALTVLSKTMDLKDFSLLQNKIKDTSNLTDMIQLELEFHKILLSYLDNKYIEQVFQKITTGYLTYAIQTYGTLDMKLFYLEKLIQCLLGMNLAQLDSLFYEYFKYYSSCFPITNKSNIKI